MFNFTMPGFATLRQRPPRPARAAQPEPAATDDAAPALVLPPSSDTCRALRALATFAQPTLAKHWRMRTAIAGDDQGRHIFWCVAAWLQHEGLVGRIGPHQGYRYFLTEQGTDALRASSAVAVRP